MRRANLEFFKLFPTENHHQPHYYQFMNCYEVLTRHPKWSSENSKTLRSVQTKKNKGKNKAQKSNVSSSPGDSEGSRDQNFGEENEDQECLARCDEDSRPIGVKNAKKKNTVVAALDARIAESRARFEKGEENRMAAAEKKVAVMNRFADIEREKLEMERQKHEIYIMEKDLTNMDEASKLYWLDLKNQIIRGKVPTESSSSAGKHSESMSIKTSSEKSSSNDNEGNLDDTVEKKVFDICLRNKSSVPILKKSLLEINKEKRKQTASLKDAHHEHLRPGMVLLRKYISLENQVQIVKKCQELGIGGGGFYKPGYEDGAKLRLHMMCLGKNWDPQSRKYEDKRSIDGATPPEIPEEFKKLVSGAIEAAHGEIHRGTTVEAELPPMSPDICIVNFYPNDGKLGLHQDKDESEESLKAGLPVISFSIGDSAEFLYSDGRDESTAKKVLLESGDVLIFGGESRRIFHGVPSINKKTAPHWLNDETNLRPGRLNLTFRQY